MDGRAAGSPRDDPEDERWGIGENFCQPPPLPLLVARADIEPPELPGLGVEPQFELLRVSEFRLKRRDPLFELVFPGRATSRPFPVKPPGCRLPFEICDCPRPCPLSNDRDVAAVAPRAEKKCWFCDTFRTVEGAAGRPLAEKLSRLGVIGSLPVVKRAFWNCA
jgi:hypothetical protein